MKDVKIMLAILFLLMVIVLTFVFPKISISIVWILAIRRTFIDNQISIIKFFNKQ